MTEGILWNSAIILSRYERPAKANGHAGTNISLKRRPFWGMLKHSSGGIAADDIMKLYRLPLDKHGSKNRWPRIRDQWSKSPWQVIYLSVNNDLLTRNIQAFFNISGWMRTLQRSTEIIYGKKCRFFGKLNNVSKNSGIYSTRKTCLFYTFL